MLNVPLIEPIVLSLYMAPPLPLVAVLLANLPEISPIEALLALYIAPPLPAAVLPSKSAAILLIDLLLYIAPPPPYW